MQLLKKRLLCWWLVVVFVGLYKLHDEATVRLPHLVLQIQATPIQLGRVVSAQERQRGSE